MKMLAIYVRVRCGIPVILMGEAGIGKTHILSYLCLNMLQVFVWLNQTRRLAPSRASCARCPRRHIRSRYLGYFHKS